MKEPDRFIKILSVLIIVSGLLNFFEAFSFGNFLTGATSTQESLTNNTAEFMVLVIGVAIVIIGFGIWKLKKLALYAVGFLIGYEILAYIIFIFSNPIDTVTIFLVSFLIFKVYIFSYLWQKRELFT